MKPIAIFYHCRLSGGDPPINIDHAISIMSEQMLALKSSGLLDAAEEFYVGVNGGASDAMCAKMIAPEKAVVMEYPAHSKGEQPTLHFMRKWAMNHPDWYVLYQHIKGALHPGNITWQAWRRCMQNVVVNHWQTCVGDLDSGCDTVGAHYMTPEKYGQHLVSVPYWGGNFWWAKSNFIQTLPPIADTAKERLNFYDAEAWIGRGTRRAVAKDYAPHWPGPGCMHHA